MVTEDQKTIYKKLLRERKLVHKNSAKQSARVILFFVAIGVVLGVVLGILLIRADNRGLLSEQSIIHFIICFYVLLLPYYVLHIIIHEAGHLLFGLMTGYHFLSFRILSIIFYRKEGRMIRRKFSMKGTAGQCLMSPPERQPDGSYPYFLYNFGGGLCNILCSMLFLLPAIISTNPLISFLFYDFVFIGLVVGASNIIPVNAGIQNDGMNLKCMRKDSHSREAFYLILEVNAEMSEGKLLTDYPESLFDMPKEVPTNSLTASIRFLRYEQQLALHDYEAAEVTLSCLADDASSYVLSVLNLIEIERLFFLVIRHHPLEEVAATYKYCMAILTQTKTHINIQRVRYIYETLLSEEDKKDIITLITKATPRKWKDSNREQLYQELMKTADRFPVVGEAMMNLEIIEYLSEIEKSRNNELR